MSEKIKENNGTNPGDVNFTNVNSPAGHSVQFRLQLDSGEVTDPTGCLLIGSTGALTQWAIVKNNVNCSIFAQDCANPQGWVQLEGGSFLYNNQYYYTFNCDFTNKKVITLESKAA